MTKGTYTKKGLIGFLAVILLNTLFNAFSSKAFADAGTPFNCFQPAHLDINFKQTGTNHIAKLFEVVNLNEQEVKEELEEHAHLESELPFQFVHERSSIVYRKLPALFEQPYKLKSYLPFYILFHSWKHFLF
jgi:hypothetical protein